MAAKTRISDLPSHAKPEAKTPINTLSTRQSSGGRPYIEANTHLYATPINERTAKPAKPAKTQLYTKPYSRLNNVHVSVDEAPRHKKRPSKQVHVMNTGEMIGVKENYGQNEYTEKTMGGKHVAVDPAEVNCTDARKHEEACEKCKDQLKLVDREALLTFAFYVVASGLAWGLISMYFVE